MRHLLATTAAAAAATVALLGGPAKTGSDQTGPEGRKLFECRMENDNSIITHYFDFDYPKRRVSRGTQPDRFLATEMYFWDAGDTFVFNENEATLTQWRPEELAVGAPGLPPIDINKREALILDIVRYTFNKKSREIYALRRGFSNWGATYGLAEDKVEYRQNEFRYKCVELKIKK
jgi:hypothetical protein